MTANEIPGICCDDSVCVCVRAYICIDKSVFFKKKKNYLLAGGRGISRCGLCQRSSALDDQVYIIAFKHVYIHISMIIYVYTY